MNRPQQLPCIKLALTGEVQVDFRYPSQVAGQPGETDIWAEVHARRSPETALFIDDRCVYKGAFVSEAEAVRKLAAMRPSRRQA